MIRDFVVDNSVVMSWCFKDKVNPIADAILDRLSKVKVYVPCIWPLEVVNVLLVAERRKIINEADSIRFVSLLSHLPIFVEHEKPNEVMKDLLGLARSYKLSSYDAAYLDLALKKGLPLATMDGKLKKAAKAVNIAIWPDS